MKLPDFAFETPLWKKGHTVIGIDEVGRGAFAGPVGVGGVVFDPKMSSSTIKSLLSLGINDSKKLSPKRRFELSRIIKDSCLAYDIQFIDVDTINRIGVGKATFLGMRRVVDSLNSIFKIQNSYLLVDGFKIPGLNNQQGIIYGDSLSISIAAASIIAKVARDQLMQDLGLKFPFYAWENNKGYGTLIHRRAIASRGLTEFHREVFCKNSSLSL